MKTLAFIMTVCLASVAWGQDKPLGPSQAKPVDPCENPDSTKDCWLCFTRVLLPDCQKFEQEDIRAGCIKGANTFLEICMDNAIGGGHSQSNHMLPETQSWSVGSSLERNFIWPQGSALLEAWLQTSDREAKLDLIVEEQPNGDWIMVLEWPQMNVSDSLGTLVFRWTDDDGEMQEGLADIVLFSADSNGDGKIDQSDYQNAIHFYCEGTIDLQTMLWVLNH